ncbi:hypothetical protein [Streptomyces sioyaensis]|uniref:hypothetical protein n=1 Tax=Streptomyces sioyaensis TaxID=67364 RepID=UPI00378BB711
MPSTRDAHAAVALGELAGEVVRGRRHEQAQRQQQAVQIVVLAAVVTAVALDGAEMTGLLGRQAGVLMKFIL